MPRDSDDEAACCGATGKQPAFDATLATQYSCGESRLMLADPATDPELEHQGVDFAASSQSIEMMSLHPTKHRPQAPPPPPPRPATGGFCERYRVFEFVVAVVMMGVAGVFSAIPVHPRAIPGVEVKVAGYSTVWARDPTLDLKKEKEEVPMIVLTVAGVVLPMLVNVIINFALPKCTRMIVQRHDTRDFALSLAISIGLSQFLTQFMKNMTGRFRPCFYDMCDWNKDLDWDGMQNLCRDKVAEQEARKSFPSGHSSYSWGTFFLLTLYLLGRSRLVTRSHNQHVMHGARNALKYFICFLPTCLACWVCGTRSVDNWHNPADIVAGCCIGAVSAFLAYNYNYPAVFSWEYPGKPIDYCHEELSQPELNQGPYLARKRTSSVPIPLDSKGRALSLVRLASEAVAVDMSTSADPHHYEASM